MNNSAQQKSLQEIILVLRKIFHQLNPHNNAVSFTIITGKTNYGKTTLLNQSNFVHCQLIHANNVNIFYNKHGVIIELNERWLHANKDLLTYALKKINHCYPSIAINGLLLCIDTNALLTLEPKAIQEYCQQQIQLLKRFNLGLSSAIGMINLN